MCWFLWIKWGLRWWGLIVWELKLVFLLFQASYWVSQLLIPILGDNFSLSISFLSKSSFFFPLLHYCKPAEEFATPEPSESETEQICQNCIGHLQLRPSQPKSPRNQVGQKTISSAAKGIDLLIVKKEACGSNRIRRCLSHYCHRQQKGLKLCGGSNGASLCKINKNQFLFISKACSAWQGNKSQGAVVGKAGWVPPAAQSITATDPGTAGKTQPKMGLSPIRARFSRKGLILARTRSKPRQTQDRVLFPPRMHLAA